MAFQLEHQFCLGLEPAHTQQIGTCQSPYSCEPIPYWCGHRPAVSTALWMIRDKFTCTSESCGEKGMARPSLKGRAPPPLPLTGFSWLSNSIHQRRFSFIIFRFVLGNYFLQIAMERMLLITSYRLTRKRCCKCKGTIRIIGLVTLQYLGELAQTSGSYFKDMQ